MFSPQLWNCLGRITSCGLIGGDMPLAVGFEVSESPNPVSTLSFPLIDRMQALIYCFTSMPADFLSCALLNPQTLTLCSYEPRNKHFIL